MWQVIGQDRAVELLRRSLENGRLAHAYLFTGQPHVGKMTLAVNLAQALNCEKEERPCGECKSCLRIAAGNHPDVQIIGRLTGADAGDGSSKKEIGIAQIRELQHSAALQPYEGKYRVYIIDGAEYLNEESANCLLKTLEEPPPTVLFILLAVHENRLLPTIVSRCQRLGLFPHPASVIEKALVTHWQVAPEKARLLSRLCRGGIGWAVSALRDEGLLEAHSQNLDRLLELTDASLQQRFSFAAGLAAQYSKGRSSVEETLNLWQEWWRDVLLVKEDCSQFVTNIDREAGLRSYAECYNLIDVRGFMEAVRAALQQLEQNANPRLVLEVLMLNMPARNEKNIEVYKR
jgi:DNA polymerase-3 subunit delta'